jgi:FtsP/CotA-like multicopper oxidase with cupredoxin domain
MVSDFFLTEVRHLVKDFMGPDSGGFDVIPDNITMNNYFSDNYYLYYPIHSLTSQDTNRNNNLRLRIINSAAGSVYNFSVDGLFFHVIEIDGISIKPLKMTMFRIHPAQRVSIIVNFNNLLANPVFSTVPGIVSLYFHFTLNPEYYPQYDSSQFNDGLIGFTSGEPLNLDWKGLFIFDFTSDDHVLRNIYGNNLKNLRNLVDYLPNYDQISFNEGIDLTDLIIQKDENLMEGIPDPPFPFPSIDTGRDDYHIETFSNFIQSEDNSEVRAFLNDGSFVQDISIAPSPSPPFPKLFGLLHQDANYFHFQENPNRPGFIEGSGSMPFVLPANQFVDIFINGYCCGTHPFHLHGHHFWILNTSDSSYAHTAPEQGSSAFPYRDIVTVPSGGFAHIRIFTDNPGLWLFHCHLFWHFEMGLGAMFFETPADSESFDYLKDHFPEEQLKLCQAPISEVNEYSEEWTFPVIQKKLDKLVSSSAGLPPRPALPVPTKTPTIVDRHGESSQNDSSDGNSTFAPSFVPTINPHAAWWYRTRAPHVETPTATTPAPVGTLNSPTVITGIPTTAVPTSPTTTTTPFTSTIVSSSTPLPSAVSTTTIVPTSFSSSSSSSKPTTKLPVTPIPSLSPSLTMSPSQNENEDDENDGYYYYSDGSDDNPNPSRSPSPSVSPVVRNRRPSRVPRVSRSPAPINSQLVLPDAVVRMQYFVYLSNLQLYPQLTPQEEQRVITNMISTALIALLANNQELEESNFFLISFGSIHPQQQQIISLTSSPLSTFNFVGIFKPVSEYFPEDIYYNNITLITNQLKEALLSSFDSGKLIKSFNAILSAVDPSLLDWNMTITKVDISLFSVEYLSNDDDSLPSRLPTTTVSRANTNPTPVTPAITHRRTRSPALNALGIVLIVLFIFIFGFLALLFGYFIYQSCMAPPEGELFQNEDMIEERAREYYQQQEMIERARAYYREQRQYEQEEEANEQKYDEDEDDEYNNYYIETSSNPMNNNSSSDVEQGGHLK